MRVEIAANNRPPERGSTRWFSGQRPPTPRYGSAPSVARPEAYAQDSRLSRPPGRVVGLGGVVGSSSDSVPRLTRPGPGCLEGRTERTPGHPLASRSGRFKLSADLNRGARFVTPAPIDPVLRRRHERDVPACARPARRSSLSALPFRLHPAAVIHDSRPLPAVPGSPPCRATASEHRARDLRLRSRRRRRPRR
ncbi:MAG: hypothetical protein QOH12_3753 [Solirubrobacteraceae bacterium]|nr:hypothetical protein [Solirubrobacteraceae bacterium]